MNKIKTFYKQRMFNVMGWGNYILLNIQIFPTSGMGELYSFLGVSYCLVKKSNWTNEEDKELVELFKLGYTNQIIARKLNRTKEAVKKRLQMLKKKELICEKDRELKQIEIREIKKAINSENNRYLSNRATIRACMSAYKNNSKGDLVLDRKKAKEQGMAFPLDMPYSNINEEIRKFEEFKENNRELNVIEYVKLEVERLKNLKKEVREGLES